MGGDFGLEGICKAHEVVVFDRSALFAPLSQSGAADERFEAFVGVIMRLPNRLIPQHLLQGLAAEGTYMSSRLYTAFQYKTAGVGHKDHKALRRKTMDLVWKREISEEDRYALLLAVALARDTKKQEAKSTAYISGLSTNIAHYHELLDFPDVVKEKATGYLWNGQIYAPVKPKVQTLL